MGPPGVQQAQETNQIHPMEKIQNAMGTLEKTQAELKWASWDHQHYEICVNLVATKSTTT